MARPRSPEAHQKVIQAAIALFGERGIEATSMDAIARTSGVSKATIYKHWRDKEALLMEVMLYVNGLDREPQDIDTGDLGADLATVLNRRPPGEFEEARNLMTPTLIAYSAVHAQFGQAWRRRVMDPPRRCLERILQRGIKQGLLSHELDMETSMALLLGPMLYQHIFSKGGPPAFRDELGTQVAEAFCRAHLLKKLPRN